MYLDMDDMFPFAIADPELANGNFESEGVRKICDWLRSAFNFAVIQAVAL